jgi:hypothetical protein
MDHPVITDVQAKIIGQEIGEAIWQGFHSWLCGSTVPRELIDDFAERLGKSIGEFLKMGRE